MVAMLTTKTIIAKLHIMTVTQFTIYGRQSGPNAMVLHTRFSVLHCKKRFDVVNWVLPIRFKAVQWRAREIISSGLIWAEIITTTHTISSLFDSLARNMGRYFTSCSFISKPRSNPQNIGPHYALNNRKRCMRQPETKARNRPYQAAAGLIPRPTTINWSAWSSKINHNNLKMSAF